MIAFRAICEVPQTTRCGLARRRSVATSPIRVKTSNRQYRVAHRRERPLRRSRCFVCHRRAPKSPRTAVRGIGFGVAGVSLGDETPGTTFPTEQLGATERREWRSLKVTSAPTTEVSDRDASIASRQGTDQDQFAASGRTHTTVEGELIALKDGQRRFKLLAGDLPGRSVLGMGRRVGHEESIHEFR